MFSEDQAFVAVFRSDSLQESYRFTASTKITGPLLRP